MLLLAGIFVKETETVLFIVYFFILFYLVIPILEWNSKSAKSVFPFPEFQFIYLFILQK